ncbi:flagellar brake protein [Roseateles sp. DAIF2]|uniref:flagellar brake protein n=1 Tax=Roseateles sp. DAIF2 TaxID=2714952 RepID=UPI0018A2FA75|nr:flagellar brake protein [Roseateles sp. DAIF2]QPF73113.1 flagellar brake protein [Roseateles sp. DAIF2]
MTTTIEPRLDDFRVETETEIESWLRQLLARQIDLQLSTPRGDTLATRLWNLDPAQQALGLEALGGPAQLQPLLDSPEVMAVAYLDQIRLEFELAPLVLVQGPTLSTLRAPWPDRLFRFQRRQAFRVQPLGALFPRVLLQHPDFPDMALQLRVLDLSVSGLAMRLPPDLPHPAPGQLLAGARIELDRDNHFQAELRLQHLSESNDGLRLGCAFSQLPHGAERALQLYIDQTQKRQRLLKKS